MMLLSRFWYIVLSLVMAGALYVAFLAVGQYNRRNAVAMNEELAGDSQVVGWALQIDSRHRLDALLVGAVDKGVQDALSSANGRDPLPRSSKDGARRALVAVSDKLAPDYKEDALFAVDRDGRIVAQLGFDSAADDMELGGYPAVFDALHGYLRDDTWVFGDKMYRVVARPVELDVTQPPVGAIVGLKLIDPIYAKEVARRTRANVAFYANGRRLASAVQEGFDASIMDQVATSLPTLAQDKAYTDSGHSEVHSLSDTVGAMYARIYGDGWDLGAGYAVARTRAVVAGPMGFIAGADDKDKANVNWGLLVMALVLGAAFGIAFTFLEHTVPLRELVKQAASLKRGELDFLQLPRFRGAFRGAAQDLNQGLERIVEKGGGAARRPADLEQILGPANAQPAMSAFALPGQDGQVPPPPPARGSAPSAHSGARPNPAPPPPSSAGGFGPPPPGFNPGPPPPNAFNAPPNAFSAPTPLAQPPVQAPAARPAPPPPAPAAGAKLSQTGARPVPPGPPPPPPAPQRPYDESEDEEATMVAAIPAEVLAAATGEHKASEDVAEWLSVYEDFIRTKKQCGEATDGLTFDKFQHTLKKNRDALMQRHGCRRVRFSVYVKEGRASLKATPVKE